MASRFATLLSISTLMFLGACSSGNDAPGCASIQRVGIVITVVDAKSLARITNATGIARSGDYVETLNLDDLEGNGPVLYGAYDRPGTYSIEVSAPMYETLVQSNVVLESEYCGVTTLRLEARLEPAGS